MFCTDYSMMVTVYEICEVHFRLLGTSGYHLKAKNKRSYDGNCKENVTLKLNFTLNLVFCDFSVFITLYKIGEVHFRLLGTNDFHVKAKNERFAAASRVVYDNFTSSFGRLHQKACRTCSTIIFLYPSNQILGCGVVLSACCRRP